MAIGFIGLGNMASAIMGGMLKQKIAKPEEVLGADKAAAAGEKVKTLYGIRVLESNIGVAENSDVLFLAVKPVFLPEVIAEIKDSVKDSTVVVSIVAGKTMQYIENLFGKKIKLVRCMPNTPALVLEGCTAYTQGELVSDGEMMYVKSLLEAFGKAYEVEEHMMDAVVGVSGSSPAYVFMFIEAMADAAVLAGMPRKQAYEMAAQAVAGSARLVLETGKHPGELKDMVCSPGGTSIEAVKVLEEMGFRAAVMDAMEACIEKSKNL